ncbi:hypothetical protein BU23DRAFT_559797 [Bimuria novae-zelandiae CBS 107.79]|uniref:Uncharacterized protein n=1 Tax=Bimuria novae-zelandiae CBS 107.79 TaxID=1447943 RepID=A0A6A5UQ10_9PLEO|nr:hypothetical protein BU23DRAFT_559797 [Bimuria novae-zelandiae CBS 107.79]
MLSTILKSLARTVRLVLSRIYAINVVSARNITGTVNIRRMANLGILPEYWNFWRIPRLGNFQRMLALFAPVIAGYYALSSLLQLHPQQVMRLYL